MDGGAVGEGELDADGKAAIEVPTLTAGDHTVRAEYAPTGDFATSQGETSVAIGKAETTTSLNVRPATTVAGQSLELSVSVRGGTARAGTPTGTIEFSVLGVGPIDLPQPLNGDGAVRLTVFPPAGSHRIQARYSGDADFVASTDEVGHQTRRADTVTTITSSPNPNPPGATIDVTIDVSIVPPGDVAPFGTLQIDVNGSPLGDPIPLDGAEGVELTLQSSGGARTDTIGVAYSGDENTNPSSASLRQTVQAAPGDPAMPGAPSTPGTPATPGTPTTPTGPAAQPPSLVPTAPAVPVQRAGPPAAATLAVTDLRAMTSGLVALLRRRGLAALRSSVERLAVPGPGVLSQRVTFAPAAKRRGGSRARARRLGATAARLCGPGRAPAPAHRRGTPPCAPQDAGDGRAGHAIPPGRRSRGRRRPPRRGGRSAARPIAASGGAALIPIGRCGSPAPDYPCAMATTVAPDTHADHAAPPQNFGTGRLFLADSRLAFAFANHLRYLALRRVFGVSREQANVLTAVLLAGGAEAAYLGARTVVRAPLRVTGADAALGGAMLRESMFGMAGPASRETPMFGALLALGLLGGLAAPGIRRAMSRARGTEQRLRRARISQYAASRRPGQPSSS